MLQLPPIISGESNKFPSGATAGADSDIDTGVHRTSYLPRLSQEPPSSSNNLSKSENNNLKENSKRRRGGWWDKSTNKEVDMNNIKQMLRKTAVTREVRVETNHQEESNHMEINNKTYYDYEISGRALSPLREPVAPAAEAPSSLSAPRRKIKVKTKKMKEKEPWQDLALSKATQQAEQLRPLSPIAPIATKNKQPNESNSHYLAAPLPHQLEVRNRVDDSSFSSNVLQSIKNDIETIQKIPIKSLDMTRMDLYAYMLSCNLEKTAESLKVEANLTDYDTNYLKLKQYISNHDFGRAIVLVQHVLAAAGSEGNSILPSFEDLMYVLSKYLFISLAQKSQMEIAERTLKMIINPLVQKEQKRGGVRSEWFTADYHLLQNLISNNVSPQNLYANFDWESELSKFWEGMQTMDRPNKTNPPPLFAYALSKYFPIKKCLNFSERQNETYQEVMQRLFSIQQTLSLTQKPKSTPRRSHQSQGPLISNNRSDQRMKQTGIEFENSYMIEPSRLETAQRDKDTEKADRETYIPKSEAPSSTIHSRGSAKFRNEGMPPILEQQENANFALSLCCGPSNSQITVMDVIFIPETGQIIAITAGSEKDISVWDVKENQILNTLNNGSSKPIVCLMFHPSYPELFISADMEFDVKLWNWRDGTMVRWWKKHHSRVIYQIGFLPGDDTRAVSCSADQSLKVWNIHADKTTLRGSIHANEPITSFVFCGSPSDPLQQKIVISLSYTIRIYKLRTLSLLHSINMNDLKLTKSPIVNMQSHPIFDNFILLASDHQLRLFDLNSETTTKTYSARVSSSEIRLRGQFSPSGTFIFSGTHQVKHGVNFSYPSDGETHELTGNLIWKLHSGKLEQKDMNAMEETGSKEHAGKRLVSTPVILSKWMNVKEKSKSGERKLKIFIQSGLDKILRVFIG